MRDVVLLHASLGTRSQWRTLCAELGPGHRVLALDLYGYGDAPPLAEPHRFTLRDEAERVIALADTAFGFGRPFHLIGHSYGGAAALCVARDHPERIAGVAVYEPVCFNLLGAGDADREEAIRIAEQVAVLVRMRCRDEAARVFIDFWNGAGAWEALPQSARVRCARAICKVVYDFQAAFREPFLAQAYAGIAAPALILRGTRSQRATRRIAAILARALPNSALCSVEGDHMAPVNAPQTVNAMLRAFLEHAELRGVTALAHAA